MLSLRMRAWSETLSKLASAAKEVLVSLSATRWSCCRMIGKTIHVLGFNF